MRPYGCYLPTNVSTCQSVQRRSGSLHQSLFDPPGRYFGESPIQSGRGCNILASTGQAATFVAQYAAAFLVTLG
ncbi:hypothetical protein BDW72DRAFT_186478 [Aspergillus terricola var. indicus]